MVVIPSTPLVAREEGMYPLKGWQRCEKRTDTKINGALRHVTIKKSSDVVSRTVIVT